MFLFHTYRRYSLKQAHKSPNTRLHVYLHAFIFLCSHCLFRYTSWPISSHKIACFTKKYLKVLLHTYVYGYMIHASLFFYTYSMYVYRFLYRHMLLCFFEHASMFMITCLLVSLYMFLSIFYIHIYIFLHIHFQVPLYSYNFFLQILTCFSVHVYIFLYPSSMLFINAWCFFTPIA